MRNKIPQLIKRRSKVQEKNMPGEPTLNFNQWKTFSENYKPMSLIMACWPSIRFRIIMEIVLERHFALLLWTLNIFCNLIYCSYSEFEQLDAGWASETIVTDNQVVFRTVRNIFSYGLGKFVGLNVFIFTHPK